MAFPTCITHVTIISYIAFFGPSFPQLSAQMPYSNIICFFVLRKLMTYILINVCNAVWKQNIRCLMQISKDKTSVSGTYQLGAKNFPSRNTDFCCLEVWLSGLSIYWKIYIFFCTIVHPLQGLVGHFSVRVTMLMLLNGTTPP